MMGGKVYAQSDGLCSCRDDRMGDMDMLHIVELSLLRRQAQMWRN